MSEDYLGLDTDETEQKRGPALVLSPPMRNNELLAAELRHRNSGAEEFRGADMVVFIDEDGSLEHEDAARWQAIMEWPRFPTVDEVDAFKANRQALLEAAYWETMREAVEKDDAEQAAVLAAKMDKIRAG
jgi:hypothetical protein